MILVYTGVIEPRLAKDLLARGVDDIVFKPFDFGILAVKLRVLVERRFPRMESNDGGSKSIEGKNAALVNDLAEDASDGMPVSLDNLKRRLTGVSRLLPISQAALDVYKMTNDDRTQASHLAAAIQRDAAFAAELLRLANSSSYNSSRQPVVQLDRAVVRIGQKRIGELALGMSALAALTASTVPWMDLKLGLEAKHGCRTRRGNAHRTGRTPGTRGGTASQRHHAPARSSRLGNSVSPGNTNR